MGILRGIAESVRGIDIPLEVDNKIESQKYIMNSFGLINVANNDNGNRLCVNIAHLLSRSGSKVLMVDCNDQYPSLHTLLEMSRKSDIMNLMEQEEIKEEEIIKNISRVMGYSNLYVSCHNETKDIYTRADLAIDNYVKVFKSFVDFFDVVLFMYDKNILNPMNIAAMQVCSRGMILMDNTPTSAVNCVNMNKFMESMGYKINEVVIYDVDSCIFEETLIPQYMNIIGRVPYSYYVKEYSNRKETAFALKNPIEDKEYKSSVDGIVEHIKYRMGS